MAKEIAYRYVARDAHYIGIPARDLTAEEYAALDDLQQHSVATGLLYEATSPPAKDEKPKSPSK